MKYSNEQLKQNEIFKVNLPKKADNLKVLNV